MSLEFVRCSVKGRHFRWVEVSILSTGITKLRFIYCSIPPFLLFPFPTDFVSSACFSPLPHIGIMVGSQGFDSHEGRLHQGVSYQLWKLLDVIRHPTSTLSLSYYFTLYYFIVLRMHIIMPMLLPLLSSSYI